MCVGTKWMTTSGILQLCIHSAYPLKFHTCSPLLPPAAWMNYNFPCLKVKTFRFELDRIFRKIKIQANIKYIVEISCGTIQKQYFSKKVGIWKVGICFAEKWVKYFHIKKLQHSRFVGLTGVSFASKFIFWWLGKEQ